MKHVLIVDDSPTEIYVLKSMLEKNKFRVTAVASGEEALKVIKSVRPDVILMDIVMPGTNGFQATRQLTKEPQTAHIPIIMVSSKSQETDRVWASRQGAKAYLTKPVKEDDLMASIKAATGE